MLEFEWDEQKRQSNLNKHGIDFVLACRIFEAYTVEFEDTRYNYGEDRFIAIEQNALLDKDNQPIELSLEGLKRINHFNSQIKTLS